MANQDLVTAIQQLRRQQELSIEALNNHLAVIAVHLETIANNVATHVHAEEDS